MSVHEVLMEKFPVRRSKEEKQCFRQFVLAEMKRVGWEAHTETTSRGGHENVVIGDPEHAAVVFSAHYDTAADMLIPNLQMPRNIPMHLLYQAAIIAVLILLGILAGALVGWVTHDQRLSLAGFLLAYVAILVLIGNGRSNKHNANDNTSGVAAVLKLALSIPEEQRPLCAFILFDNEERGRQGSKYYAKEHLQQQYMRLLVNLDSVGDGEHMLVISKDMARKCTGFNLLSKLMQPEQGVTPHFFDSRLSIFSSDQTRFKCGVAVTACHRVPVIGYVTGRLHTSCDTVCRHENLAYLNDIFVAWIDLLSHGV